jgi:hypothetical protein
VLAAIAVLYLEIFGARGPRVELCGRLDEQGVLLCGWRVRHTLLCPLFV